MLRRWWWYTSGIFIIAGFVAWAGGLGESVRVEAYELFLAAVACSICSMWLEGRRERKADEAKRTLFITEAGVSSFFVRTDTLFKSNLLWYRRLWRLMANPFSYLVRGEMRW